RSFAARAAWRLWTLAAGALVAAVAAGLAARSLSSGTFWWAQLAAVGLPYAAGLLALATVVPLLARRWGWVLVHAVLVGLVAWRALPGDLRGPAPLGPPGPDDLVLMTFNLPAAGPSREALGDSSVSFVRRTNPDILLMQDAWAYEPRVGPAIEQSVQVAAVEGRLPYDLRLPRNLLAGDHDGSTGVPVLIRRGSGVTVVRQDNVILAEDATASLAIRTEIEWRGRSFVLYNLHLRSFGERKPWNDPDVQPDRPRSWIPYLRTYRDVYAQRGAEADRLAERVAAETLPVIIAGDFNSTADNETVQRLRTAGRPAGQPRIDAFRAVGGWTWGRTYHAARPVVRIDFVLVDPALTVVGADVTDVAFSDHRPVRAHLRWAAADPPASDTTQTAPSR
ncbi:MAG TPA: endonuclease/exonuclease/phosphatase family protein, partial [Rubricoccaceae bacterium]